MKNGFFSPQASRLFTFGRSFFPFLLVLFSLQGCASFLQLGSSADDPAEYDRGYARDGAEEEGAHTDSITGKKPASDISDTSDELSYEQRRIKRAIDMRDVVLGMSRHEVAESWGQPVQREVAGRGTGGHERWTYGSRYSLTGPRTVIFENGRVAGWNH
jgi:hypothetical protein